MENLLSNSVLKIKILILICIPALNASDLIAQNWVKLKNGLSNYGDVSLYVDNERNELYIHGFLPADREGNSLRGITKWNGYTYGPVAQGGPLSSSVHGMGRYKGKLYLSTWVSYDTSTFDNFKYWASYNEELNKLDTLDFGLVDGETFTLETIDNKLFAAGYFKKCGNDSTFGLCYFDGADWHSLYSEPNTIGWAMGNFTYYKDDFYVGGAFYELTEDSELVDMFAILEDGKVKEVGTGLHGGGVSCLTVFKDELYVGGYYLESDGNPANHIVRWDGTQYKKLGNGPDNSVSDMIAYNGNLYICGPFTYVDGIYSPYVARWDGEQWYAFNTDYFNVFDTQVDDIEIFKGELYISGHINTINGDTFNHVAKYNHQLPGEENELEVFINNPGEEIIINYEDTNEYVMLVNVYTVSGEQVREFTLTFQQGYIHQTIPVTGLAAGVYIVEAITNNKKVCKKLLKMN